MYTWLPLLMLLCWKEGCLYSMFLKALFTFHAVMLLINYLYQQLVHLLLVICKIEIWVADLASKIREIVFNCLPCIKK